MLKIDLHTNLSSTKINASGWQIKRKSLTFVCVFVFLDGLFQTINKNLQISEKIIFVISIDFSIL